MHLRTLPSVRVFVIVPKRSVSDLSTSASLITNSVERGDNRNARSNAIILAVQLNRLAINGSQSPFTININNSSEGGNTAVEVENILKDVTILRSNVLAAMMNLPCRDLVSNGYLT